MDGLIDEWMDGRADGWMEGWVDCCMESWIGGSAVAVDPVILTLSLPS